MGVAVCDRSLPVCSALSSISYLALFRLLSAWLLLLIGTLALPVYAEQVSFIRLHKGPGEAFPVIAEIPQQHQLTPQASQRGWVLLADQQKQGWADVRQLQPTEHLSRAQLWHFSQNALSPWQLHAGLNSLSEITIGASRSWRQYRWQLDYRQGSGRNKNADGAGEQTGWQSLNLGVSSGFWRYGGGQLRGLASIGVGFDEADSRHWSDAGVDAQPILFTAALTWQQTLTSRLKMNFQAFSEHAFADEENQYQGVAMQWSFAL